MTSLLTLAQNTANGGGSPVVLIVELAIMALTVVGMYKVFEKAGQPGWAAIIPIFNFYILCKVAGRPAWWTVLMLIPVVNLIAFALVCMDVAKAFGKGAGFGFGLFLFGFICFPMLGFSPAQYRAPGSQPGSSGQMDHRAAA